MTPIIFVLLALVFCGIFLTVVGFDPFAVYGKMVRTICSSKGFVRSIEAGMPYRNDPASCDATMQTLFNLYSQWEDK